VISFINGVSSWATDWDMKLMEMSRIDTRNKILMHDLAT